jgi:hypothetical protein
MLYRIALLLAVSASAAAQSPPWTPYDETIERQRQVTGEASASIDHLVPVDFSQVGFRECLAGYTAAPSFTPSEGWCLTRGKDGYVLDFWKDPPAQQNTHSQGGKGTVPVDEDLAVLAQGIWINALLDTHYPSAFSAGLDGTTYYFHLHAQGLYLRGQTWSPSGERPPAWLVSVAADIMTYARSENPDADRLRTTLTRCKERLFSYYRKRSNGGA